LLSTCSKQCDQPLVPPAPILALVPKMAAAAILESRHKNICGAVAQGNGN
jgi:hypothetical protein